MKKTAWRHSKINKKKNEKRENVDNQENQENVEKRDQRTLDELVIKHTLCCTLIQSYTTDLEKMQRLQNLQKRQQSQQNNKANHSKAAEAAEQQSQIKRQITRATTLAISYQMRIEDFLSGQKDGASLLAQYRESLPFAISPNGKLTYDSRVKLDENNYLLCRGCGQPSTPVCCDVGLEDAAAEADGIVGGGAEGSEEEAYSQYIYDLEQNCIKYFDEVCKEISTIKIDLKQAYVIPHV